MSQQLIKASADLQKLRDDGFDLEVKSGYLLVKGVPYVNSAKVVKYGTLVSELKTSGDVTAPPDTHVAYFIGECPCLANGAPISKIVNSSSRQTLAEGVEIDHTFSSKPRGGRYRDYHEKITTYVAIVENQARVLHDTVTARNFNPVVPDANESVFHYEETASSRAGIARATEKLKVGKIAIIGMGGTGSYVLDLVAKCPVGEIHPFDGDHFFTHNAFRSPGAPSVEELRVKQNKAVYWATVYSKMHRHVIPHDYYLHESNVDELDSMDFVFLCLDRGTDKKAIVQRLIERNIPFIDIGMGVNKCEDALLGIVRVTAITPQKNDHVAKRVPFSDGDGHNEYTKNIQIADLNALNATLAVIKWKKLCGFYLDLEHEHFSAYTIDGNTIDNEESA